MSPSRDIETLETEGAFEKSSADRGSAPALVAPASRATDPAASKRLIMGNLAKLITGNI
jgi:hypothetical protein